MKREQKNFYNAELTAWLLVLTEGFVRGPAGPKLCTLLEVKFTPRHNQVLYVYL